MKKINRMFISTGRANKCSYMAKPSADGTSVIIQRIMGENGNAAAGSRSTVAAFIDCDEYVASAIETDDKQYALSLKQLADEYIPDRFGTPRGYRSCCVECVTRRGNVMRVRPGRVNRRASALSSFVITVTENGCELVAAEAEVDDDDEMSVLVYGYPAGYEAAL